MLNAIEAERAVLAKADTLIGPQRERAQSAPIPDAEGLIVRHEANVMTRYAFRTSHLENLHAGIAGFSDEDMKKVMTDSSARLADLLFLRRTRPDFWPVFVAAYTLYHCRDWTTEALSYEPRATDRHPCASCGKDVRSVWKFCAACGVAQ